jgi:hypothetical protein
MTDTEGDADSQNSEEQFDRLQRRMCRLNRQAEQLAELMKQKSDAVPPFPQAKGRRPSPRLAK